MIIIDYKLDFNINLRNIIRMRNKGLCTKWLEPSSGVLQRYHLTRGSTLTSQDYNPISVIYVPEQIRAI